MAEYIDIDAPVVVTDTRGRERETTVRHILKMNKGVYTAADVRPVVLCRDCKWYEINELKKDGTEDRRYKPSVCMLAEQHREPNHFCADGEKREESE